MENNSEVQDSQSFERPNIQLDYYRWVIVALFAAYCGTNFFLFIQFTIIANITERYYNVNSFLTDTTGLVFMASYIILFVPVGHYIERNSLKKTAVISSGLTAVGNFIKLFAASPDKFYLIILSQIICGIAQVFMISIPSKVAATWFGAEEVSIACAIGVMGCQMGLALGCTVSTFLVPDSSNMQEIAEGFSTLFTVDNVLSITMFGLVVIFFRSEPRFPPSHAQANRLNTIEEIGYMGAFKCFTKNREFMLILITFGMSYGLWNCLGILVNELFLHFFPGDSKYLGILILCAITSGGVFGTIIFGYILDKTHAFKKTTNYVLMACFLSWIGVIVAFETKSLLMSSIFMPICGFFGGSLMVLGFEYVTETTHPIPEEFSASFLNAVIYMFAIVYVLAIECVIKTVGFFVGLIVFATILFVAAVFSMFLSSDYKRYNANLLEQNKTNYGSVITKENP